MGILIIITLAVLFGPGFILIFEAYNLEDIKPKWKKPMLRIGIFLLMIGMTMFLLLLKSCNELANNRIM